MWGQARMNGGCTHTDTAHTGMLAPSATMPVCVAHVVIIMELNMNMAMKQYDGMLSVACILLAAVLNLLQISYIADGLVMASQQGRIMATLSALVISSGLFYSVFTGHRLWLKGQPRIYAWMLGSLAGILVGAMAAWSLSYSAEVGSARFWIGIIIGFTIPGQTIALCNMTDGMRELAGSAWWKRPQVADIKPFPVQPVQSVSTSEDAGLEPAKSADEPTEVCATSKARTQEIARAVGAASHSTSPCEPAAKRILSSQGALEILITGDRVKVRVGRLLSNRKWKHIHSDLRRIPSILWDEAQKAKSSDGRDDRILHGTMRIRPLKGRKNKKKERAARKQQLEDFERKLQWLVERHNST